MRSFNRAIVAKGILIVLIFGIVFALPAFAESNPTVMMIDVEGNNHISDDTVLGAASKTQIGQPLNVQSVQQDMQSIMDLGCFANIEVKTEKFFDGIKLVFVVVENPVFKEIQFSGLTKAKNEDLKPFFTQKAGDIFNFTTFKEDLSKALKYFREEKGLYIEIENKNSLGVSADGVVNVKLVELKVGQIKILGLVKTKEIVVRRELSLKEGDILDSKLLRQDYLRLMRLQLFDSVEPRFENSATLGALDIVYDCKEANTGTGSIGFSYNESTSEMQGLLGYSEANLMGLGQNLSLDLKIGESGSNIKMSFLEPWLDDKHTSFGISMWNSENEITSSMTSWLPGVDKKTPFDMDLNRMGLSLSFGRRFWQDTTARIKFNFEKNEIESYWANLDHADNAPSDDMSKLTLNPTEFWDNSVELQLVKNKLEYADSYFINGGYQLSGSYSVAGEYLGGDYAYQTLALEGKWFHSLSKNLVFGSRVKGTLLTGDYPDYDSLYIGGQTGLRGYHDRRFHDESSKELIGDTALIMNNELRYRMPFNKDFELVAFYDIGQIENDSLNTTKSDYGLGFRYNVPILGLIRIDKAWNSDGESEFVFSLGEMF